MGSMIAFEGNGDTYNGYLAPAGGGRGPGVIVLQEWWGLVPHIMDVVDRFAKAGFTALAPDLYEGQTATGPDEAGRLMMAIEIGETAKVLRGAVKALLAHPACSSRKVGAIGFCMGGQLALYAGTLDPNVGAIVDFYGIHPKVPVDYSKLQAQVLGIFAEKDTFVNAEAVEALERDLKKAGKQVTTKTYKNVDHAFFNDSRPDVYHAENARHAWELTVSFLGKHLS